MESSTRLSGTGPRDALGRREVHALPISLAVLIVIAAPGRGVAQSRPQVSTPGSLPLPAVALILTGDDARRVERLEKQIGERERAGRFDEALPPACEALRIRERVQGADHWQALDARRGLETLRRIAAMPPGDRAALASAERLAAEGDHLFERGEHAEARRLREEASALLHRFLGSGHERTAAADEKLAYNLYRLGLSAQAEPLYREALQARLRALGEDHPDTARLFHEMAYCLDSLKRPAEAGRLFARALRIWLRTCGEDHPDTASGYDGLANHLKEQGRHAEAEPLFRKALAIDRKALGDDHGRTACVYFNLAYNLFVRRQPAEAEPLHRKSLAIRLKVLGEDHPDTAHSYNGLAWTVAELGRTGEAEPLHRRALAIRLKVLGEDHLDTAHSYNGLAGALYQLGRPAEAEPAQRKALAIYLKLLGQDHPDTAGNYHGLAWTLEELGRTGEAEPFHRKALAIRLKVLGKRDGATILSYLDLAYLLRCRAPFDEAESQIRQAVATCQESGTRDEAVAVRAYRDLGSCLEDQGRYLEAESSFRQELAISRRIRGEDHPQTALAYHDLAVCLQLEGKHREAEPLHRTSLEIGRRCWGDEHPLMVLCRETMAACLMAQGKEAEAEAMWTAAARNFEVARLRSGLTGLDRVSFTAWHAPLSSILAVIMVRQGRNRQGWERLETGLARGLLDDLSRPLGPDDRQRLRDLRCRLQQLDERITALLGGDRQGLCDQVDRLTRRREVLWVELADMEIGLTRKYGPAAGQVFDLGRIQARIPADAALVAWLDVKGRRATSDPDGEHWACVVRHRGEPGWVKIRGTGRAGDWTPEDDQRPGRLAATLSRRPDAPDLGERWMSDFSALARQRLAPLERHLGASGDLPAVTRLIILPSPDLAGLPVEAMVEARSGGRPCYTISYAPSGTLFAWLRERRGDGTAPRRPADTPRLLALGDPAFAGAGESNPPAPETSIVQREVAALLSPTRGEAPVPLPGTRREVLSIAGLFERPETLLGPEASEQRLDDLARSGRLREFDFLHLATHGKLDDRVAMHSALLLARVGLPDPKGQIIAGREVYDGELTAEQIIRTWTLDSELVTLSACQTALGRPSEGEGYLGFSQALFLAGARSVVLSLWNVDDAATTLLMTRFYRNLLGRRPDLDHPMPKAEALSEAKRWLRALTSAEVDRLCANLPDGERIIKVGGPPRSAARSSLPFEHPYYWAAFVLIGDPN